MSLVGFFYVASQIIMGICVIVGFVLAFLNVVLYFIHILFYRRPKNTYDPLSSSLLTCLLLGMMASSDTKTDKSKSLTDNKTENNAPGDKPGA